MTDNVYCGINKLPKGMRYATPQEAFNKKQIRRYGEHEVDVDKLRKHNITKKKEELKKELYEELTKLEQKLIINKARIEKAEDVIGNLDIKMFPLKVHEPILDSREIKKLNALQDDRDEIDEKLNKLYFKNKELRYLRQKLKLNIKHSEE